MSLIKFILLQKCMLVLTAVIHSSLTRTTDKFESMRQWIDRGRGPMRENKRMLTRQRVPVNTIDSRLSQSSIRSSSSVATPAHVLGGRMTIPL